MNKTKVISYITVIVAIMMISTGMVIQKEEMSSTINTNVDLKDFKITGYELNDSGTINKYDSGVTGDLVKNTKNTKIRFYVAWVDDDTNEMDNSEDTTYAVNHNNVIYNLTIKFTQKK